MRYSIWDEVRDIGWSEVHIISAEEGGRRSCEMW